MIATAECTLVKCRFLDENGEPKGREYTYGAYEDLDVGQVVVTEGEKSLVVTCVDLMPDAADGFGDKLKFVAPKQIVEGVAEENVTIINDDQFKNLIIVEQIPVITEQLALVSAEIDRRIAAALALDCTEDSVKHIKAIRAALNKEKDTFEERRKQVKNAVMSPYETFESAYKEHVLDKYKGADAKLKTEIDKVESEIKRRKLEEVKSYFDEYCLSVNVDFVNFDALGLNVTLTASVKSLKDRVKEFISRVVCDLTLIETQDRKAEILVEYRRSLNVSQAIKTVIDRHKAIEEQKARAAQAEAHKQIEAEAAKKVDAALPPPTATKAETPDDPVYLLPFAIEAPVSHLKEIKQMLKTYAENHPCVKFKKFKDGFSVREVVYE